MATKLAIRRKLSKFLQELHVPSFAGGVVLGAAGIGLVLVAAELVSGSFAGQPDAASGEEELEVVFEFPDLLREPVPVNPESYGGSAVRANGPPAGAGPETAPPPETRPGEPGRERTDSAEIGSEAVALAQTGSAPTDGAPTDAAGVALTGSASVAADSAPTDATQTVTTQTDAAQTSAQGDSAPVNMAPTGSALTTSAGTASSGTDPTGAAAGRIASAQAESAEASAPQGASALATPTQATPTQATSTPAATAEATSTPAAPVRAAPVRTTRIYIQAASFRDAGEASQLRARLLLLGWPVNLGQVVLGDGTWNRVTVGPIDSEDMADQVMSTLREQNLAAIRINPG